MSVARTGVAVAGGNRQGEHRRDEPYRRALTDEQAIGMLLEQRGRAYDPLVVDTFARVFREIAPVEGEGGSRGETLRQITQVAHTPPASAPRSASA